MQSRFRYWGMHVVPRLMEQGDTVALYDIQPTPMAMAQRCQRVDRLVELAELLGSAYSVLEVYPEARSNLPRVCVPFNSCTDFFQSEGKASLVWVCKGGLFVTARIS